MAVTAGSRDGRGATLDSKITAIAALPSGTGSALMVANAKLLDQAQREAVYHYLDVGRITAASILSSLS